MLKFNENERNFSFADCCRPIPGDEVMGFINDRNEVEVHALTCPRAQVLKASYGPRILATRWDEVAGKFMASIRIEGIDRHGILSELTRMMSTCDLGVLVGSTADVDELCKKVFKINGVKRADRVKQNS